MQEPEDYDPTAKKIDDPVAYYRHKEAAVVEQYVKVAEAKVRCTGTRVGAGLTSAGSTRLLAPGGRRWVPPAPRLPPCRGGAGPHGVPPVSKHFANSTQLWRRKLRECYLEEGVDHLTQCKEVRALGWGNCLGELPGRTAWEDCLGEGLLGCSPPPAPVPGAGTGEAQLAWGNPASREPMCRE